LNSRRVEILLKPNTEDSGVAMGWAEWAKSRGPPSEGAPEFQFQGQSYKVKER